MNADRFLPGLAIAVLVGFDSAPAFAQEQPCSGAAIERLRTLAMQKDVNAQLGLGDKYAAGCGVSKDLSEAIKP